MDWGFLFIEGLLIAIFIALIIEASIANTAVNKDKKSESDDDKQYYDTARYYLGWCIGVGWTLFALGIILFIANLFFTPEEAGALEAEEELSMAKKEIKAVSKEVKSIKKSEDDGLFGFKKGTSGFFKKLIYFLTLGGLFAFGVLAAIAATAIGRTSTKKGYGNAIAATVLGILPFSILIIWWIANKIYVSRQKEKLRDAELREKKKAALIGKRKGQLEGELKAKTGQTKTPTKKASPKKSSPTKKVTSMTSSISKAASDVYNSLSKESKEKLSGSALSTLKSLTE
jgi:hypothetical protein